MRARNDVVVYELGRCIDKGNDWPGMGRSTSSVVQLCFIVLVIFVSKLAENVCNGNDVGQKVHSKATTSCSHGNAVH